MNSQHIVTDILIIGAGGAGMVAAIEAARGGAQVMLLDRSLIGRGGATVMAQMTVAAAVGAGDHWNHHLADTITAGRGLCDPALAQLLCQEGPECIDQMDQWGVGWARISDHDATPGDATPNIAPYAQVMAPGHDRPRCVYVDFLNTGPAVSQTLRKQLIRAERVRRIGDLLVTDVIVREGRCVGACALHLPTGEVVTIAANVTIIAAGGLTRLYERNSASANMGGDGYALALRAGAELIDMEFVQFFPIGHLAPRLIGMDPIMWDPFRYKLGGRLLNGAREEFVHNYGTPESGKYVVTRDLATYAITKEVAAGRGSPHGGAYLSFEHVSEAELRAAFGPVIDRLAKNGIDLTRTAIEVAPIAHYHMGGVRVDPAMRTTVPGLLAAGEVVGGANGANRLSGNAITEALVFGRAAGRTAAAEKSAGREWRGDGAEVDWLRDRSGAAPMNVAAMIVALQSLMTQKVGPFRNAVGLSDALHTIRDMQSQLGECPPRTSSGLDATLIDWLDLRQMLLVAESVTVAALARAESRGAHQREDFPTLDDRWQLNQRQTWRDGKLMMERAAIGAARAA